jgi:hypothetical protein
MAVVTVHGVPALPGDAQDDQGDGQADEGVGYGVPIATTIAEAMTAKDT